jgi:hypothetical protein
MRGDSMGNLIWQNRFGGEFSQIGRDLDFNQNGILVFGGQGPSDNIGTRIFTLRLNEDGDLLWSAIYSGPWGGVTNCYGLGGVALSDGAYMMLGDQYPPDENETGMLLIRTHPEGLDVSDPVPTPNNFTLLSAYPNPFNAATTIQYRLSTTSYVELKLHDVLGRQIQTLTNELQLPGEHHIHFDGEGLASGVYFARLKTEEEDYTIKLMLEK